MGGGDFAAHTEAERRAWYAALGLSCDEEELAAQTEAAQAEVSAGRMTHAQGVSELYGTSPGWRQAARAQTAEPDQVALQHRRNEDASCRCVGLSMELRPDTISCDSLIHLRMLGATKVQFGVQSLFQDTLDANCRGVSIADIARAFSLCRLFGFKIHVHYMANLPESSLAEDKAGFVELVGGKRFCPDEIKLYPCVLIEGSELERCYREGTWHPYREQDLVELLAECMLATPPYVRISRMIRDFSADDIAAGNKKVNLREVVEERASAIAAREGRDVVEIRHRELAAKTADIGQLSLSDVVFATSVSCEHFLQWTAPDNTIAGFLRLSLPDWGKASELVGGRELPFGKGQAMIREVHVYGRVAALGSEADAANAQHKGLGTRLIERACEIAAAAGYEDINVISAVGTRGYYRERGFVDAGMYQRRALGGDGGTLPGRPPSPSVARLQVHRAGEPTQLNELAISLLYEGGKVAATDGGADLARVLQALNKKFYREHADSFSATRSTAWDGWRCCLHYIEELVGAGDDARRTRDALDMAGARKAFEAAASERRRHSGENARREVCRAPGRPLSLRVLDVACGNLRFEQFLEQELSDAEFSFDALDDCPKLLPYSLPPNIRFQAIDVLAALGAEGPAESRGARDLGARSFTTPDLAAHGFTTPGRAPHDLAVTFGFMHHVPSQALRARLLTMLVDSVRPGGIVIASFWRFLDDSRFAAKALAEHEVNLARLQDEGLLPRSVRLSPGDMLLGWQGVSGACRFCHSFSDDEIDVLACSVSDKVEVAARFKADGKSGRMNEYLILRRPAARA